jgi:hypothetical protein
MRALYTIRGVQQQRIWTQKHFGTGFGSRFGFPRGTADTFGFLTNQNLAASPQILRASGAGFEPGKRQITLSNNQRQG